jgi:hypothetical protein
MRTSAPLFLLIGMLLFFAFSLAGCGGKKSSTSSLANGNGIEFCDNSIGFNEYPNAPLHLASKMRLIIKWPQTRRSISLDTSYITLECPQQSFDAKSYVYNKYYTFGYTRPSNNTPTEIIFDRDSSVEKLDIIATSYAKVTSVSDQENFISKLSLPFSFYTRQKGDTVTYLIDTGSESAVKSVDIFSGTSFLMNVGESRGLDAYAYSDVGGYLGAGRLVYTRPEDWDWSLDNNNDFELKGEGNTVVLTQKHSGVAHITATYQKNPSLVKQITFKSPDVYAQIVDIGNFTAQNIAEDGNTVYGMSNNKPVSWTKAKGLYLIDESYVKERGVYVHHFFKDGSYIGVTNDNAADTMVIKKAIDEKPLFVQTTTATSTSNYNDQTYTYTKGIFGSLLYSPETGQVRGLFGRAWDGPKTRFTWTKEAGFIESKAMDSATYNQYVADTYNFYFKDEWEKEDAVAFLKKAEQYNLLDTKSVYRKEYINVHVFPDRKRAILSVYILNSRTSNNSYGWEYKTLYISHPDGF